MRFVRTYPQGERGDKSALTHPIGLTLIAFICTAVPSFLMTKIIGKNLESLIVIAAALIIGGLVMWVIDAVYGARKGGTYEAAASEEVERMSLPQSIWIGLCQTLSAIFPGTSRSMATIAAGQVSGLSRTAALEFSFLLSIPTMAAATGYDLLRTLRPSHSEGAEVLAPAHIDIHGWLVILIGFIVSFIVAYGVVAWFMNWVRNRGFTPFAIYRIVAGAAVLMWALNSHAA